MAVNLERNRFVRTVENLALESFPMNFELHGVKHLVKAHEILDQGGKIYNTPDHRSTADSTSTLVATTQVEPWRRLVDRSVIIIKDSYFDNRFFRLGLSGVRTIGAVSPSMKENAGLTKTEQAKIQADMLRAVRGVPGGNSIVLAPEVTRVREGGIQQARRELTLLWNHKESDPVSDEDVWFLPTAHEGTEEQWGNSKLDIAYYFLWRAQHVKVKYFIGEPFRLTDVKQMIRSYEGSIKDTRQLEVDLVMMQVALLHMNHGDPWYAGEYYPQLLQTLQTEGMRIPNTPGNTPQLRIVR